MKGRALLLWAMLAPASYAQFQLLVVSGGVEQPTLAVYDFGAVDPGTKAAAQFRIRNTSATAATLDAPTVAGAGFTVAAGPAQPVSVDPQASVDFTVAFQASNTGSYSAALSAGGNSVLLTASVPPRLTYEVETGAGLQPLGAAPVDFGTVQRGASAARHFAILNQSSTALAVPPITVTGAGFALSGAIPSGILLQTGDSARFDVQFSPAATGALSGSLVMGDRTYGLTGVSVEPPLPAPRLSIALAQPQSAQTGAVSVSFGAPAQTTGSGTVTLAFQPNLPGVPAASAADPAIAFGSGGLTATFSFSPGDTQGRFGANQTMPFQTGSTAGTIAITAQLGGVTDRQTITIAAAAVGVTAAQGSRVTGSIEVQVTGFDNTRTAGRLTFTFFDANGSAVAPGAIAADSTTAFASYFQNSSVGGVFLLRAVFPVTGDATVVKAFEVQLTNTAGTAKTARTSF